MKCQSSCIDWCLSRYWSWEYDEGKRNETEIQRKCQLWPETWILTVHRSMSDSPFGTALPFHIGLKVYLRSHVRFIRNRALPEGWLGTLAWPQRAIALEGFAIKGELALS